MGYQIYIGEACVSVDWDERRARVEVETVPIDDPSNPTGRFNWIESGYNEWSEFVERIGLQKMFYGMRDKCGNWWIDDEGVGHNDLIYTTHYAAPLTEAHFRAFVNAKNEYPKWTTTDIRHYDMIKLEFLLVWTRWALIHAKRPTFYNG